MFDLMRKALFRAPPELAHEIALESLRLGHNLGAIRPWHCQSSAPVSVMGLDFPNPVGMAAGMDKNGDYIDALGDLGFGFIEVGTVTPRPQPGNPKPRVFRIEQANALINRLGFNNKGVDHLVARARARTFKGVLGINIGKNFDTPNEQATEDYLTCFDAVYEVADYITLNISSPNTKGLRDLHGEEALDDLLSALAHRRKELESQQGKHVPVALKIAPDLEPEAIPLIAKCVTNHGMEAVIATNTTIARTGVEHLPHGTETGGLSGTPVFERSNEVLAAFRESLPSQVALIGVGGILCGADAAQKIELGADLVQFYTGFVYRGPQLVGDAVAAISQYQSE